MANLISVRELSCKHGARPLFQGLAFGIDEGERIGLIGPNGAGKSTLVRVLAGVDRPASGTVSARRGLRVAWVAQEEEFPAGATVGAVLEAAAESQSGDEATRAATIALWAGRAGFEDLDAVIGTLSGGWRKRVSIVRSLVGSPDLLLLDEPTNHLDIPGVEWLESVLESASCAALVVTHDRYFLENVATRLIDLDPRYADGYLSSTGGYSDFVERKAEYLASQDRRLDGLDSDVRREVAWLRRGARARSTKAKGRIEDAGELFSAVEEMKGRLKERSRLAAEGFAASGRRTRELVSGKSVAKQLGVRPLFSDLDFVLGPGVKLGVVGPNGSGKTTLMRLIAGDLEADSGVVKRAEGLKIVRFDQLRADLDRSITVREALCPDGDTVEYQGAHLHVSAWGKRFGLAEDRLGAKVGTLSGGEQARLCLARLMVRTADILLLDEPTNDLDLESLQVLEDALIGFGGAMVLATHDRYFLDKVANQILVLGEDDSPRWFADYSQYARRREERTRPAIANKEAPPARVKAAALTATERKELAVMETRIEAAERLVAEVEARMAAPEVASDAAELSRMWDVELPRAKAEVDRLYARWDELEAKRAG